MNLPRLALLAVLGAQLTAAQAVVVNIGTRLGANPVEFADPGEPSLLDVGQRLTLPAGEYLITPVDTSFAGALYTAALRFSNVALPSYGYEWNYFLSIDGGPGTQHGFGEGVPANSGNYQASAEQAFALAPAPLALVLTAPSTLTFYWRDVASQYGDNSGGISLSVSAVPEPSPWALLTCGGLVAATARRWRRLHPVRVH